MRFYKMTNTVHIFYGRNIEVGDIICISRYFKKLVIYRNSITKVRFITFSDKKKINLLVSGRCKPLTKSELNKIKPHLRREHLKYDL